MIQIVPLAPEEWPAYRQIRLEALCTEPQAFGSRYADAVLKPDIYWQEQLIRAHAEEKFWLRFAKSDDRVVGLAGAFCSDEGDCVTVFTVYVTPAWRGQGGAAALLEAVLAVVGQSGRYHKATLCVNVEQAAAVALYQRVGFEIVGQEDSQMGDGLVHTEYLMEKVLA